MPLARDGLGTGPLGLQTQFSRPSFWEAMGRSAAFAAGSYERQARQAVRQAVPTGRLCLLSLGGQ
jgi:hypothetical protein